MQTNPSRCFWPVIVASLALPIVSSAQSAAPEPRHQAASVSRTPPDRDTPRVVMVTAPGSGDTTFVTLDPPRWEDDSDRTRNPTAAALQRLDILTLADEELARFGMVRDESGVWIISRAESGETQEIHVGSGGTQFRISDDERKWEGLDIHSWRPVLVTDEQGAWRMHEFDGDVIAPELARRERELPVGSDERFQISEEIGRRAEEHLAGRLDSLIPILVTATGSGPGWSDGSERSIVVLWYERTPEVLSALPQRVASTAGEIGVSGPETGGSTRSAADGSRVAPFDALGVAPNPVAGLAHLSFTIGTPSEVTLQVYDLKGEAVLSVPPISCTTTGGWMIAFDAAGLSPGMYIVRLQNAEGAAATTRFVVPGRKGGE